MRIGIAVPVTLLLCTCGASLAAAKDFDELRNEIAAKLDAKGVKGYELTIIDASALKDEKVVSCDGGSRKITYSRK